MLYQNWLIAFHSLRIYWSRCSIELNLQLPVLDRESLAKFEDCGLIRLICMYPSNESIFTVLLIDLQRPKDGDIEPQT